MSAGEIPIRQGWLRKQGHVRKNWKMRWCILDDSKTMRYSESESTKPKGEIDLSGYSLMPDCKASSKRPFSFALIGKKTFIFQCAIESERTEWIEALRQLMQDQDTQLLSGADRLAGWKAVTDAIDEEDIFAPALDSPDAYASRANAPPSSATATQNSRSTSPITGPALSPSTPSPAAAAAQAASGQQGRPANFGILKISGASSSLDVKGAVGEFQKHLHFSKFDSYFPLTEAECDDCGWSGDIDRQAAEARLNGLPSGTFLTRWSSDGSSFVVSYVKTEVPYRAQHIAYISVQPDKTVKILASDASIRTHDSLRVYIQSLLRQGVITHTLANALVAQQERQMTGPAPETMYDTL